MIKLKHYYKPKWRKIKVKVFLDLDDTLVDTSKAIEKMYQYKNYGINTHIFKKNIQLIKDLWLWNNIKNNPDFWENLPKRQAAEEIYQHAKELAQKNEDIYILTALPKLIFKKDSIKFKLAAEKKIQWVKKHFPEILEENILVVHAIEKKNYAMVHQNAVLYDDSLKNILAWKKNGGTAYLVTKEKFEKF